MNKQQNYINHIVLVLDASGSMGHLSQEVVKVADNQIAYLAQRSKELDQETRVTVYSFNYRENIQCLIYDKDVLRMPSIANLYRADGSTALIDATLLALRDLSQTSEKYGEHSFLVYVLTDGEENNSAGRPYELADAINGLPDNWTLAAFVPNQTGVFEAKKFGFSKDNIAVWDATTARGVSEAGEKIRQTTETFMQNRAKGIRGSRSLFSLAQPSIKVVASKLASLHAGQYRMLRVDNAERIDTFIEGCLGRAYKRGEAYYQLTKSEEIQASKEVAILSKSVVYIGKEARDLLGLPDHNVNVRPVDYPDYEIFVQSLSLNRKLVPGTRVLVLS